MYEWIRPTTTASTTTTTTTEIGQFVGHIQTDQPRIFGLNKSMCVRVAWPKAKKSWENEVWGNGKWKWNIKRVCHKFQLTEKRINKSSIDSNFGHLTKLHINSVVAARCENAL